MIKSYQPGVHIANVYLQLDEEMHLAAATKVGEDSRLPKTTQEIRAAWTRIIAVAVTCIQADKTAYNAILSEANDKMPQARSFLAKVCCYRYINLNPFFLI